MNRIDDPRTKVSIPKRSKCDVKFHKFEGLDLFNKIDTARNADLSLLKVKHWKIILVKLNSFVETDFKKSDCLKLQNVFYKVIESTHKISEIRSDVNTFFTSVILSKCFDNIDLLEKRFVDLAEYIYRHGDLLALRFAELGLMYNLIGLRNSVRNQLTFIFLSQLDKTPPFNWASQETCILAIEIIQNFDDEIFEIFLKHSPIPENILVVVIKNKDISEEQILYLVQNFVERGARTFLEYENQMDALEAALLCDYRRVVNFLLSKAIDLNNVRYYFALAVNNNDSQTVVTLTTLYQGNLISEDISPNYARSLRPLIESISNFGRKRFQFPEDLRRPLPEIKESVAVSSKSSLLIDQGILTLQVIHILSEGTITLINDILKDEPQALSLIHFRKDPFDNPDVYYYILFKRLCHVWSFNLTTTLPGLNEKVEGSFAQRQFMISYYVQFLELFNRSWLIPILDQANKALRNFFDFTKSEKEIILGIGDSNNEPIVWTSGYSRHYANVITFKNYVVYCDRGGVAKQSGYRIYQAKDRLHLTSEYMTDILDCSKEPKDSITEEKMVRDWNLELLDVHEMKFQKVNGCTQTGTDSTLIALLTLLNKMSDPNLSWKGASDTVLPLYKKVTSAYRYYTALDLIHAFDFYTQGKRDNVTDNYFYKMFLSLYLRLKENPDKLIPYTDQGPNLINHFGHIINFLSRD